MNITRQQKRDEMRKIAKGTNGILYTYEQAIAVANKAAGVEIEKIKKVYDEEYMALLVHIYSKLGYGKKRQQRVLNHYCDAVQEISEGTLTTDDIKKYAKESLGISWGHNQEGRLEITVVEGGRKR